MTHLLSNHHTIIDQLTREFKALKLPRRGSAHSCRFDKVQRDGPCRTGDGRGGVYQQYQLNDVLGTYYNDGER